jgi:hypothetical protein
METEWVTDNLTSVAIANTLRGRTGPTKTKHPLPYLLPLVSCCEVATICGGALLTNSKSLYVLVVFAWVVNGGGPRGAGVYLMFLFQRVCFLVNCRSHLIVVIQVIVWWKESVPVVLEVGSGGGGSGEGPSSWKPCGTKWGAVLVVVHFRSGNGNGKGRVFIVL